MMIGKANVRPSTSPLHNVVRKRDFYAGGLMILLGLGIALKGATYRSGTLMHMGPGFLPTALGIILFGSYFGMIPGTFACVFIAAMGDRNRTWKSAIMLSTVVTAFGVGLFSYVLQVPMPILTWGARL